MAIGVRASYLFGIVVCLCSVWISGLDERPRKDSIKWKMGSYKDKKEIPKGIDYHYLKNTDFNEQAIANKIIFDTNKTIDLNIKRRNSNGSGTAFKVRSNVWITARHVIDGCNSLSIPNVQIERVYIPPSSDIALILSSESPIEEFYLNRKLFQDGKYYKRNVSEIGEYGYSIGFPRGEPGQSLLKFVGYVQMRQTGSYYLKEPVKMWIEIKRQPESLDHMGGISGGPILNGVGDVVGVHVANSVRRGRAYSVDEFAVAGLMMASLRHKILVRDSHYNSSISEKNWSELAAAFRENGQISKILCSV